MDVAESAQKADNVTICGQCGQEIHEGDWPFCPHGSTRPEWAQRFDPIVVDWDPKTGQFSHPAHSSEPVPEGYERRSLTTLRQVDEFCRARTAEESAKRRDFLRAEKSYWDDRIKARREFVRDELKRRGYSGRGWEKIQKFMDERRDARHAQRMQREVVFFSDVFAHDSSNRSQHSGEHTAWKQRKA